MSPGLTVPRASEITHILDLPALHTRPPFPLLLSTLQYFTPRLPSWDPDAPLPPQPPANFSKYLLSLITSPLSHLTPDQTDEIQTLASNILAALCGRTAAPPQSRTFNITNKISVELHEPTLTGDSLGHKTWGSAYTLARRLLWLEEEGLVEDTAEVIELGAGTGLVGISAAKLWRPRKIVLTDIPEIVDNLRGNVARNDLEEEVDVEVLDWREAEKHEGRYGTVLVADPIYDRDHPALVVRAVEVVLRKGREARCVVEMPVREGYGEEREEFRRRMGEVGLRVVQEGRENGWDDWGEGAEEEGGRGKVEVWWSVWAWAGLCSEDKCE